MLKKKLLDTGYFIDNAYLDDYINLTQTCSNAKYTERHHILPRAYYKLVDISIDNSENNLVRLSFADHCKAHWLLYFCTKDKLRLATQTAFMIMVNGLTKRLPEYTEDDFNAVQELKYELLENSDNFWSAKDDEFLKQNFLELSDDDLATRLNKTVIAIRARRTILHLQRFKMNDFSEEELTYLVNNFNDKTINELAANLGRTVGSITQKCNRLGLKKKAESWSDNEIAFLRAYATTKSLTELSDDLGRSKSAIKRQCHIQQIKCKRTDLWTDDELRWLKESYATKTAKQLAEVLGRSRQAINHKCQALSLVKNKKVNRDS